MNANFKPECIVIGSSAGGFEALSQVLKDLPKQFDIPILITQHRASGDDTFLGQYLQRLSGIVCAEAQDKERIEPRRIYLAPADYHLLVEQDKTLALSADDRVNYSRPSIDVLFESAAETYGEKLLGIILTGANSDGSVGIKAIKEQGGQTFAQDPKSAHVGVMPQAAIDTGCVDEVLDLDQIAEYFKNLVE